ncbi:MAG: WYL domain-containing transcriptional regulator [Pseudomonadales bacterium]|nr:WYL domain-containing transcriptional regulator [Pseudomonadales bacterium]
MDRFDRIYKLHGILKGRRTPISRRRLEEELECSRASVKRIIEDMRNYLNAPVIYDRARKGYLLDLKAGETFELPGLWFNAPEVFALLTTHRLLSQVQPGLLEHHVAPFRDRLEALLKNRHAGSGEIFRRVRILQMAPRATDVEMFQKMAGALLRRQQVRILYHSRSGDEITERWVSPQRVVYYRDNWYLDAWCHLRNDLRSFAMDSIASVQLGEAAKDISEQTLDEHFTQAYGIFAGPAKHQAVIRFSGMAARWVADEQWHPEQQSRLLPDGGLEITVPYGDPRELVRDILKYGPDAEVLAPESLRDLMTEKLDQTIKKYKK